MCAPGRQNDVQQEESGSLVERRCSLNLSPKRLPVFFDIDLVTCVAFDSINQILADTGVFRCKGDTSTRSIDNCGGVGVEAGVAARARAAVLSPLEHIA